MKYKFIKNLGSGSYGQVVLAEDRNKELFAVKKFPLYDKSSYLSFKNEIKILKKIKHKNLIKIFDYYKDRSFIYLVMEYAPYGDLDNYIRSLKNKGKLISNNTIDNIISQVTEGIDYLHINNIIHRDIKTSNILVFNENLFKITDFGVSKSLEQNKYAYTNIGTPYYMAPEIICGKPYNYSVDYWALGCMIYKLLCNKYPFEARNIGALILKIKRGYFNLNEIPIKYRNLISKLLKTNIYDRGDKKDVIKFLKSLVVNNIEDKVPYENKLVERVTPKIKNNISPNLLYKIEQHKLKQIDQHKLKPIDQHKLKPIEYKISDFNSKYNYPEKIEKKQDLPPINYKIKQDILIKPKVDCWNIGKIRKEKERLLNKKKLPPIHLKDIHNIKTRDIPKKNKKKDFIKFNRENIILMHKR